MLSGACFTRDAEGYKPGDPARSYWSRDAIGGRAVIGLIGHDIEREHGAEGLIPARLTVDMFRLAPFTTLTVETRIVRDSARLRLVNATLFAAGEPVAQASCQLLREMAPPPGRVWSPGPWNAAAPEAVPVLPEGDRARPFELRPIVGVLGDPVAKQCWIRETHELVEGEAFTPFSRVATAADYASPFTNVGDAGVRYINTDMTIHIHRLPRGEWIGFEATGHEASQGIAVGHCRLHDVDGAIGFASCAALANERRSRNPGQIMT